ncbi:MAG: T9SS type A sorting domain-containing protein [Ignavibacteria bacterium]|nr:T9SS type A sorting domain-containing protein [Ignavibacteria bacterium]
MLKKSLTIFVLLFVTTSLVLANTGVKVAKDIPVFKKQIAGELDPSKVIYLKTKPPKILGETVITTNYDYFSNSIIRDQIVYDRTTETPHLFNMVRPFNPAAPTIRHVVHSFKVSGDWVSQSVSQGSTSNNAGGWPSIDLGLTGLSLKGTVAMVFHTTNRLAIWNGSTGYNYTLFPGGDPLDPTLQIVGDKMFMASSGNRTQYYFFRSDDLGQTIVRFDSISRWSPQPIFYKANGVVEVNAAKSANERFFMYLGANEGGVGSTQGHIYAGWPKDSADNVWIIYSTNGGNTFQGRSIGWDGEINAVPGYIQGYAPLFENFGQIDGAIDNNGKMHVVANGYGLRLEIINDTVYSRGSLFPVLYWNSQLNTWKALTYIHPTTGVRLDTIQAIGSYYPTNAIGQSYPSVSVSPDGKVVFLMWTGPQLTATGGLDTAANGAATPVMYFWRDLYFTYSVDGGNTFKPVQKFPECENDKSETYGHAVQHLEKLNDTTYRAHIVYLADLTTGVGPFDNVLTDNPIVYTTYDIIAPVQTSVDDPNVVNTFYLSQNYPNPFNPTTNIKFSIAQKSHVTLKVFDVLGREVATLVNEVKDAGQYTVKFDAKDLPTGVYLYTLNAGDYSVTKKMMLVK